MANCVTCHEGKLGAILTEANFKLATCKSCHPVTTDPTYYQAGKRAPALADIMPLAGGSHMGIAVPADLYEPSTATCVACHGDTSGRGFADLHPGMNTQIFKADGTRYDAAVAMAVGTVTYDPATRVLTVPFTVTGTDANALLKPTVVVSLYGFDTKDFLVSGHGSQPDNSRNLEWTEGSTRNSARLDVTPLATPGNTSWTATADLSLWAALIDGGQISRAEIAVLPVLGKDQTLAVDATNPAIAVAGATQTVDLVAGASAAATNGKGIVDPAKCNKCHEALGTTFHSPAYGSAGTVACRTCHTVASGGSHLEMQSRSIDSYVHAIHSMQPFDIGDIDFNDPVAKLRYEHHIESSYPNFAGTLNCESCHASGTYDVPDQTRSLPSLLSASDPDPAGFNRAIGFVPAEITGPGARACGSCHRAKLINEDAVSELAALFAHTNLYSSHVTDTSLFLDTAAYVQSMVGGPAFVGTAPAGATVEQCVICHVDAGTRHQKLFDSWKNGL